MTFNLLPSGVWEVKAPPTPRPHDSVIHVGFIRLLIRLHPQLKQYVFQPSTGLDYLDLNDLQCIEVKINQLNKELK